MLAHSLEDLNSPWEAGRVRQPRSRQWGHSVHTTAHQEARATMTPLVTSSHRLDCLLNVLWPRKVVPVPNNHSKHVGTLYTLTSPVSSDARSDENVLWIHATYRLYIPPEILFHLQPVHVCLLKDKMKRSGGSLLIDHLHSYVQKPAFNSQQWSKTKKMKLHVP